MLQRLLSTERWGRVDTIDDYTCMQNADAQYIEGTYTYVHRVYFTTTGSTAINTGGFSRTKHNSPVARIIIRTCGGVLAHAFR